MNEDMISTDTPLERSRYPDSLVADTQIDLVGRRAVWHVPCAQVEESTIAAQLYK